MGGRKKEKGRKKNLTKEIRIISQQKLENQLRVETDNNTNLGDT